MPINNDNGELSREAWSLLTTLRSRGGTIRGDINKDKVMWLFWAARPGETIEAATFKELHKRRLIEAQGHLPNGVPVYRLSEAGRS
jgi:hypothetical protein